MAVYLRAINLEKMFQSLPTKPHLISDFDVNSELDNERLNRLLYTCYDGDTLSATPMCECGNPELIGARNLGRTCDVCGNVVQDPVDRAVDSVLWVRVPGESRPGAKDGVKAFLTPLAYSVLSPVLTVHGSNVLDYLMNPTYIYKQANPVIQSLKERGIKRGMNYFHDNFDQLMDLLFNGRLHKTFTKAAPEIWKFISQYRDCLFTRVLPLPSRLCFVLEDTNTGRYFDKTMADIIDAVRTLNSIEHSFLPITMKRKESVVAKAIAQFATFYIKFFKEIHGGKPGMYRKQLFGTRMHFSGRAVITSITEPHAYDEVYLPWSLSVLLFKPHIQNKLLKRGYTPHECQAMIYEHVLQYSPDIDAIFHELIAESPNGAGIPIMLHRNPTLVRGAAQRVKVTKIKVQTNINTISMSVLILSAPNADKLLMYSIVTEC